MIFIPIPVSIPIELIRGEFALHCGHGCQQNALIDERDEHHRLPVLLFAI